MHYQEAIIQGFWCYKLYPNQKWQKFDAAMLRGKVRDLKEKTDDAQKQLDSLNLSI